MCEKTKQKLGTTRSKSLGSRGLEKWWSDRFGEPGPNVNETSPYCSEKDQAIEMFIRGMRPSGRVFSRAFSTAKNKSSKKQFGTIGAAVAVGVVSYTVYQQGQRTMPVQCEGKKEGDSTAVASSSPVKEKIQSHPEMRQKMETLIRRKQKEIIAKMEEIDGKKFFLDEWTREDGNGGGITGVIEDGNVIEKGGCNISIVNGTLPAAGVAKMKSNHESLKNARTNPDGSVPFWVCGLSLIMHPKNPMAPTVHLNYRYFETQNADGSPQAWWFGGGADLTPYYVFEEDCKEFHKDLKEACDRSSKDYYPRFKKWCDEYFYNKHRNEGRGIGGIFFDDLDDRDPLEIYQFVEDSFNAFLKSYPSILNRRINMPYTEKQREWQLIRRGRYVEFNLVHDRGTAFGLQTPGARIESILVSLPLYASWRYNHHPEEGSEEERLIKTLKETKEWV
jgi:coproporphyrinogen III oxidase